MSDDLDAKPFGEEELVSPQEDRITPPMVKKATYLIHKLADRRGADFNEIQKKCKKLLGYENLAKVGREQGHRIINELIELTGGEEKKQGTMVPDDGSGHKVRKDEEGIKKGDLPSPELQKEIGKLAEMLQICVNNSKTIYKNEFGDENITEGTRATLVKSFAATIFIEAGKRGLGR